MFSLITLPEHFNKVITDVDISGKDTYEYFYTKSKKGDKVKCIGIYKKDDGHQVELSYFVGIDWISTNQAVYVEPKINTSSSATNQEKGLQTDYLKMLFSALRHPGVAPHTLDLYEIKFNEPYIPIHQKQDLLTPLIIVQFLTIVKEIVRKGLKKSYYKTEQNLHSKVKGKVMIGQTIKQNLLKNKLLNTYCAYDEFGVNGLENRLIKKALGFIQRYIPMFSLNKGSRHINDLFNFITPVFESVTDDVSLHDINHIKLNPFYKEYEEGLKLAKLILERYGYNINNVDDKKTIKVPPFWIDMSKLFELYVLSKLKDKFSQELKYHFTTRWNELDFILNNPTYKMVIDSKYKKVYQNHYDINDIRQVSGYARLDSVYQELNISEESNIDCLIIYPDQTASSELPDLLKAIPIKGFTKFYKLPLALPVLN